MQNLVAHIHITQRDQLVKICKQFGISIEVSRIGDKDGHLAVNASVVDLMQAMTFGYILGGLDAAMSQAQRPAPVVSMDKIKGSA